MSFELLSPSGLFFSAPLAPSSVVATKQGLKEEKYGFS